MSIGILIYSVFMREFETRTLVTIALVVTLISSFANVALTLQWYEQLGMSAFTFIFFTSSTLFPLILGLFVIPPFVLVAKISPTHVEATIFSFSASLINGCIFFLSRMMGVFWNNVLFKVEAEDLDNLYKLYLFEMCMMLICLCYIPLLPTWAEVEEVQKHLADLNLDAKTPRTIKQQNSIEPYEGEPLERDSALEN